MRSALAPFWRAARELLRWRGTDAPQYVAQKAAEACDENTWAFWLEVEPSGQGAADGGPCRRTGRSIDRALTRKPGYRGRYRARRRHGRGQGRYHCFAPGSLTTSLTSVVYARMLPAQKNVGVWRLLQQFENDPPG